MAGLMLDDPHGRLLTGARDSEDAAILRFPPGKALVQTVDFFTPIVNDPFRFGRIAAVNSLSDVYAMGGEPYAAMNIVCFPIKKMDKGILREILRGGLDAMAEAGAVLAGGHSVEDAEVKYGLSVSGIVDADNFASNRGMRPGDTLILTKPLGTGVLATALKGDMGDPVLLEDILFRWAGRLNKVGGAVVRDLKLRAATDVTGFGLGGHLLEMAGASRVAVELALSQVPFLPEAVEFASMGMIPAGSFANRNFCSKNVQAAKGSDPILLDLVFDAQTSGGMLLAVPEDRVDKARDMLLAGGDMAEVVGRAVPEESGQARLRIR